MSVLPAILLVVAVLVPCQAPREADPASPNSRPESAATNERTSDERRQHALSIASGVAGRARTLLPRADAVVLLIQYSDLVWTVAPDQARRALRKVVDELVDSEGLSPESIDAIPDDARTSILRSALAVAGRHDAELLDELLTRTAAAVPASVSTRDDAVRRAGLYLELARLAARQNSARAGDYLVQSLEAAALPGQFDLLVEIDGVEPAQAKVIFLKALDVVRRVQPPDLNRVSELSGFVLGPDRSVSLVVVGGREYTNVTGLAGRAPSDPDLLRAYLSDLFEIASRAQASVPIDAYVVLSNYAALYDQFDPDRAQAVASLLSTCRPAVADAVIIQLERFRSGPIPESTSETSIEQAREGVRRIGDARERDRAIVRLLRDRVLGYRDARTSSEIADAISDPLGRRQVQSLIDFVELASRCEEDTSYAPDPLQIARFGSPVQRAIAWALAGESALARGDESLALSNLDSAYRDAVRVTEPTDRILILFKIASVYASRELPQSIETLRAAIADINRSEAGGNLDLKRNTIVVELTWEGVSEVVPLSVRGVGFAPSVDALAAFDYWQTVEAVGAIKQGTARGWAELRVARRGLRKDVPSKPETVRP